MNVVFLSPNFPPQFFHFCVALKARGVNVLGIGDTPPNELNPQLHGTLAEYFYLPHMEDYAQLHRAFAYLIWRHGRIDRVDSHNEHWLGLEARLRDDFNVEGPGAAVMTRWRSKSGMAELFRKAGVPHPEGQRVESPEQVRAFAKAHGFPLVFKPDLGVGAARTFKVSSEQDLDEALRSPLPDYVVQPFVDGTIVSYDGLLDREGRVVFETSHVYNAGVMDVVNHALDLHYWNRREIPEDLRTLGLRVVETFGLRERFFHCEFFELRDGSLQALEINIRPPGGYTTDMMNYSADVDIYRLWAEMITGAPLADFRYERRYHVAHVSRRWSHAYRVPHEEVVRELGDTMLVHREMPRAFAGAMGDEMYLVRTPDFSRLQELIRLVQS